MGCGASQDQEVDKPSSLSQQQPKILKINNANQYYVKQQPAPADYKCNTLQEIRQRVIIETIEKGSRVAFLNFFAEYYEIQPDTPLNIDMLSGLHVAARCNNYLILNLLLRKLGKKGREFLKVGLLAKTNQGFTPIMMSVYHNSLQSYILLKSCGGFYISDKNFQNQTVKKMLKKLKHKEIMKDWKQFCKIMDGIDYIEINDDFLNYPEQLEKLDQQLKLTKIEDENDNLELEQTQKYSTIKDKLKEETWQNENYWATTHEHPLKYIEADSDRWYCDSCSLGLTCGRYHQKDVFEARDYPRFECYECNFDLCDVCYLAQKGMPNQEKAEEIKNEFINPEEKKMKFFEQFVVKHMNDHQAEVEALELELKMKVSLIEDKQGQEVKQEQVIGIEEEKQEQIIAFEEEEEEIDDNPIPRLTDEQLNLIPFQSSSLNLKYKQIIENCNGEWKDPEFLHCLGSITKSHSNKSQFSQAQWKKASEFIQFKNKPIHVFDRIESADILQGKYDKSVMLSILAAIAEYPDRLIKIFNTRQFEPKGVYSVTIFNLGLPFEVVIDGFFPFMEFSNELVFAKPNGNELWVILLEKAWAKFLGAYKNCEGIPASISLNHLLGIPVQCSWINELTEHELKIKLLEGKKNHYITVATTKPELNAEGMVPELSYSILNVFEVDSNLFLIKLRNPQGSLEFKGEYSDDSTKWNEGLKNLTNFNPKDDDGLFFLTVGEFIKMFHHLTIGMYREDFYLTTELAPSNTKTAYFKILNSKDQEMSLILNQEIHGNITELTPQFAPTSIILFDSNGNVISYGNQSDCVSGSQTISLFEQPFQILKQGTYYLKIKMKFPEEKFINYSVSTYSKEKCRIVKETKATFSSFTDQLYFKLGEEKKKSGAKQCTFFQIITIYQLIWVDKAFLLIRDFRTDNFYFIWRIIVGKQLQMLFLL